MNDTQLLRYSRQILLSDVDIAGQQTLLNAKVLIIGMGGLGSPVALYLAAAGVGTLGICDFDTVELSNLQRQVIHRNNSIGATKVDSAEHSIQQINPDINVVKYRQQLAENLLDDIMPHYDLVLDCSDNFSTRFAINRSCFKHKIPLVSGAVIRMEGQVSVYDSRDNTSPCYQCLYGVAVEMADTCSSNGVLGPVVGIIGSIQATEAIKCLLGLPTLMGRLLIHDARQMQFREIKLKRDSHCPCCGTE